ncbi:enolase C-terminal domain-like protein [Echinicola rosea]|uniref:Mandelate racemase n=1 Tax=Echinicola rosea TaxID=1807691 RepID=A0ABQ1V404_9BACT|nr:enolase C-terminal domain-like protein [Echinicola rosea]GGF34659.1 mandelate racemase [Echinicola rosea]
MKSSTVIKKIAADDVRFPLQGGAGSDAIHSKPTYAYAVCRLMTETGHEGTGLAFTLGEGNNLVCDAILYLAKHIQGKEINELMAEFGKTYRAMLEDPHFRWLGPHKGVVHLALASVVNACFDLWAKSHQVPLWKLLITLSPEALADTLDFSHCEEIINREEVIQMLQSKNGGKPEREKILSLGYPGYDTSIGWFNYRDDQVVRNIQKAMDKGFTAMKLKVGSAQSTRDIRRAALVRKIAGDHAKIMFDANQQWNLPQAIEICKELHELNPYWIEEPTHPDDILAHVRLAEEVPIKIALGEHVPNKILFKNFLQSGCMSFNQVDTVRVGGISEFILISLLSKKFNVPVVPHVGDMGQIHQHLVLFNHIALDHPALLLEHIPHLNDYFVHPVSIMEGRYQTPQAPGISADLKG